MNRNNKVDIRFGQRPLPEKSLFTFYSVGLLPWCVTRNHSVLSADPGCQLGGPWVQPGWGCRRNGDSLGVENRQGCRLEAMSCELKSY